MYGYRNAYNLGTRLGYRQGGASIPAIPSTADMKACWSLFGITPNYQNSNPLIQTNESGSNIGTAASEPYFAVWENTLVADSVHRLFDQSGETSTLEQSGGATLCPNIRIAPGLRVTGAGSTIINRDMPRLAADVNGRPAYALANDPADNGVRWNGTEWVWLLGGILLYRSEDDVATPDLCTTIIVQDGVAPVPTNTLITAPVNGYTGRLDFDGTDDFLSAGSLSAALDVATVSWYAIIRTSTFGGTKRPLFASDYANNLGTTRLVCGSYIDNVGDLYSIQVGSPTVVNSKKVALSANTTYIISGVYDRNQVVAADQTLLLVNNSATGVTAPISDDMAGSAFEFSINNFAMGRGEIIRYFNGAFMHLQFHNTAHDQATRTAWYNRLNYMKTYSGW